MSDSQAKVAAVNDRLKVAQLPVALKVRGRRVSLVATLPPKPHSAKVRPYQQAIALGVPDSSLGIQRAEREAKYLGALLVNGQFSWDRYLSATSDREPVAALVGRFERQHRRRQQISDATWADHYAYYYRRLPQDRPLSLEVIMPLLFDTADHSRARQQLCRQLQKLCDFAGLNVDLLQYQGRYSSQSAAGRKIPGDEAIALGRDKLRSPQWRWVYGMMAAYGLRNHECWYCEFTAAGLWVSEGKTGPRLIDLPLYPEWVERWDLEKVKRPKLQVENGYKYLSAQSSQAFRRADVAWPPYDLRYAYGHRGSVLFGYEHGIMARMMGHSVETHVRMYQRFIDDGLVRRKVARLKARAGLPKAPV
ncbi:MAG: hypothetical protein ACR2FS_07735 [Phormidesmis sp.]